MSVDRPILFSGAMVRAILDGRKSQTRRVVKQNLHPLADGSHWHSFDHKGINYRVNARHTTVAAWANLLQFCPYGQPGDRLWVRETWYCDDYRVQRGPYLKPDDLDVDEAREHGTLVYAADGLRPYEAEQPVWRPSIHMPRWASRLALEITSVRVERLNDCSFEDALAEGIPDYRKIVTEDSAHGESADACARRLRWPQRQYALLWDEINGAGAWEADPWVWVVKFKRIAA